METLFICNSTGSFVKHSNSLAFLRAFIAGHGSASSERRAMALVPSLRCSSCGFRSGSQSCSAAEHDPVSFAVKDRVRLLDPLLW